MSDQPDNPFRRILAERGIKPLPADHWIYSEGPSTVFLPPKSRRSVSKASDSATPTPQRQCGTALLRHWEESLTPEQREQLPPELWTDGQLPLVK